MRLLGLPLVLSAASAAAIAAFVACGGISDPTKAGPTERVATVTGALTGTAVPSGAHVALVWKTGASGFAVGSDVAVLDGHFTMDLTIPPDGYFVPADATSYDGLSNSGTAVVPPSQSVSGPPAATSGPSVALDASANVGSSGGSSGAHVPSDFSQNVHTLDQVGGSITQPLSGAVAGFVVYMDSNGNGQLDLQGAYEDSPDQILGGNSELLLVYFRDGGALDYEKLRDRSGILPQRGYNLAWNQGRWVPLNEVELKLSGTARLPASVCESNGTSADIGYSSSNAGSTFGGGSATGDASVGTGYPPKGDPGVHCYNDGYSWMYNSSASNCPAPPPPPTGLCAPTYSTSYACAGGYGTTLPHGSPVPSGWPCDVTPNASDDAGIWWDASVPVHDAGRAPDDAGH
jgi:hypothetical protein